MDRLKREYLYRKRRRSVEGHSTVEPISRGRQGDKGGRAGLDTGLLSVNVCVFLLSGHKADWARPKAIRLLMVLCLRISRPEGDPFHRLTHLLDAHKTCPSSDWRKRPNVTIGPVPRNISRPLDDQKETIRNADVVRPC